MSENWHTVLTICKKNDGSIHNNGPIKTSAILSTVIIINVEEFSYTDVLVLESVVHHSS